MTLPATIDARVLVSWNGSGDFDGVFDDVTSDVAGAPGIAIDTGKDGSRALAPPMVNAADFELFNQSGAYSQERPDSPIYQLVLPGRPVQIQAGHGVETAWQNGAFWRDNFFWRGIGVYTLASGLIDDLSQDAAIGQQRVKVSTLGLMKRLRGRTTSVLWRTDKRTDECMHLLLDSIGWPVDDRVIGTGDTTLSWWGCDERDAWDAAVELLVSEGPGALYEDSEGRIVFEGRNHRTSAPRSMTSQALFYDQSSGAPTDWRSDADWRSDLFWRGTAGGLWLTGLTYSPGFANIVNRATYATKRRTMGALTKVWEFGASISLGGLEVRRLIAKASDPFSAAVIPVVGTDYAVTSGSATVTTQQIGGNTAVVEITAGGGGAVIDGVTSTGIQLRAQPLAVTSETIVQNDVDATDSITKFGERTYEIAGWPEIDPNQAIAVCNAWTTRYMVQRPAITITIENADGDHVDQILRLAVSDRITLVETNTGLEADVWVETKALTIEGAGGRHVVCALGCEKVEEVGGSLWDVGLWDTAVFGT